MAENKLLKIGRKLVGVKPAGHGPFHEADSGWVDLKPYTTVLANGIFEGYDNSVWKYMGFPRDIKIEDVKNPLEVIENQHFLVEIINEFADILNSQTERMRKDVRREFHIQITRDDFKGIPDYPGVTPAHRDYLDRMSSQFSRPEWFGYMGIKMMPGSIFHEAHGIQAKVERYMGTFKDAGSLQMHLYREDQDQVDGIMLRHGFRPLDFTKPYGDMEHLTAWHGINDEDHGLPRELRNTNTKEPIHGKSLITEKHGEIIAFAITPKSDTFMVDPLAEFARWGKKLYQPGLNVVAVNIRGEIRASKIAESLFDQKSEKKQKSVKNESESDRSMAYQELNKNKTAREASDLGHGFMDNMEIVVFAQSTPGRTHPLIAAMSEYGLNAIPLIGRQPDALNSTFPTYCKPIYPHKSGNKTRRPLSAQMFAGALAMSGLFKSGRPCAQKQILLGLSTAGHEFQEIYTGIESANEKNNVPGMLVTGRPGAGKTQELLQMIIQSVFAGYRGFYLNPKGTGTLKPVFDYLDGYTINMGLRYLEENPGLADPVFFLDNREDVAQLLGETIQRSMRMTEDRGQEAAIIRTQLMAELTARAKDSRNLCSYDIIFGNKDSGTEPLTLENVKDFVENKIVSSPFWKGFIAKERSEAAEDILRVMNSNKPVLVEWDSTMKLPDPGEVNLTDAQLDTVISISVMFKYAAETTGSGQNGGMIIVDEAWILKESKEAMALLNRGLREWRQANILLVLGTQELGDFLDGDTALPTYFGRYLIMAISAQSPKELDLYFKVTGLPRSRDEEQFIINAGVRPEDTTVDSYGRAMDNRKKNLIPKAYYIDYLHEWDGKIACGPWPERELNLGRTDKNAEELRHAEIARLSSITTDDGFGGVIARIVSEEDE